MDQVSTKCPICTNTTCEVLWSETSDVAARVFVSPAEDPLRYKKLVSYLNRLWNKESIQLVSCNNCSFIFSDPFKAGDKTFYDMAYVRTHYPKWRWEYGIAINKINNTRIKSPKILEIGAGDGAFIQSLIDQNLTTGKNINAIEFSDYGKEKIKDLGVRCISEDIREVNDSELFSKFDYIVMFQVLEHLSNLDALFKALDRRLTKHGFFIASVPNNHMIEFMETNDATLDMPPNHVGRWNEKAFNSLANRVGWELYSHYYEPFSFHKFYFQFAVYRFLKQSQSLHRLENIVKFKIPRGTIRTFSMAALVIYHGFIALKYLFRIFSKRKKLSDSQLVIFKKSK